MTPAVMTSSATTVMMGAGQGHLLGGAGSGSQSMTHATSKADIRGNFNYDTGMNTAHFAKGNIYTLGHSSGHSMTASGPMASNNGAGVAGSNSLTSSSHFGGAHTPHNLL